MSGGSQGRPSSRIQAGEEEGRRGARYLSVLRVELRLSPSGETEWWTSRRLLKMAVAKLGGSRQWAG